MTVEFPSRAKPLRDSDPSRLGSYRLVGRLGSGGMGVVYLATDRTGKYVAIKLVHTNLADGEEFRRRFGSEVNRARQVPPFCTAEVLDADLDHEPPYLVVEYVDGPSLAEVVEERGPLNAANLHSLAIGVATALTAIHGAAVIHRDLKPGNVLLAPGSPKVIDFGIARAFDPTSQYTSTDQMVGTIPYMAPERFDSAPVTPAADIFAWGVVVAYAGTGRTPFSGDSAPATAGRILTQPPDLAGLSEPLRGLVELTLAKDPAARPNARQLLDLLLAAGPQPSTSGNLGASASHEATVPAGWTVPIAAMGGSAAPPWSAPVAAAGSSAGPPRSNAPAPPDRYAPDRAGWQARGPAGWQARDQAGWQARDQAGRKAGDQAGWQARDRVGWQAPDAAGWQARDPAGRPTPAATHRTNGNRPATRRWFIILAAALVLIGVPVAAYTLYTGSVHRVAEHGNAAPGGGAAGSVAGTDPAAPSGTALPSESVAPPSTASGTTPGAGPSAVPTPTSVPQVPVGGTILFHDPLKVEGQWIFTEIVNRNATCTVDGVLRASRATPGTLLCIGPPMTITGDHSIAVDVTLKAAGSCAGIWFSWTGGRGGYVLRICRDVMTVGIDSGTNKTGISRFPLAEPIGLNDTNRIQLVVRGQTAQVFRGSQYVGTAPLTASFLPAGAAVLGVTADSTTARVVTFANVEIRTLGS